MLLCMVDANTFPSPGSCWKVNGRKTQLFEMFFAFPKKKIPQKFVSFVNSNWSKDKWILFCRRPLCTVFHNDVASENIRSSYQFCHFISLKYDSTQLKHAAVPPEIMYTEFAQIQYNLHEAMCMHAIKSCGFQNEDWFTRFMFIELAQKWLNIYTQAVWNTQYFT